MILSKKQRAIIKGKKCPYCGSKTEKMSAEFLSRKNYNTLNDIICCEKYPKCDSYVGTHSTGEPLGRLANYELRLAKKKAHESFDKLWKDKLVKRKKAYKMLSEYLNFPEKYTHIGMFQISTCYKVKDWSIKTYNRLKG